MASERNAVYCTLLLSDNYLPGAMVLAHSLRDNGSTARLIALYTPDALRQETIKELQTVYNELIPVHSLVNGQPANLWLMDRPDLIATFTKIELWRLTQFNRIVYIDCDVVALRAPDELLALEVDFAAAPDVGWPDCFNSGVMVLKPNLEDYYALNALAERGISFDGADQGLLNMHFRDWHRLSFTYNCTPSANYQYIPAYKHFQSTISMIHFIGSQKPWNSPRHVLPLDAPYNQLLGKWWAVYDKHYRPPFAFIPPSQEPQTHEAPYYVPENAVQIWPEPQHVHHPEPEPTSHRHEEEHSDGKIQEHVTISEEQEGSHGHAETDQAPSLPVPTLSAVPQYVRGEEHVSTWIPPQPHLPASTFHPQPHNEEHPAAPEERHEHHEPSHDESHIHHPQPVPPPPATEIFHRPPSPEPESPKFEAPKVEWDASREPPPLNSKPEGISLEQKTYTMSEDTTLFQPPPSYPEAPKNMYYQVPVTKPEPQKISQIFPWESHAPKPTRVFAYEQPIPTTQHHPPYKPSAEKFENYSHSNAWDEDPHIQRYIESIQAARRARTQVLSGNPAGSMSPQELPTHAISGHRPSILLTDFPTEVERPSLPVTPAPIERRPGNDDYVSATALPAAEGVPDQEDWVGVTVDAFSTLLRATYLFWQSTESNGEARGAEEGVRGAVV
ncbi:hypothetical protein N7532_010584 [Penicillium argentinense]|uniref:glycogenin glucosyltransferase n=1 Tax=Penicillium argentinense TaxID=1131581 RepID=A0A9W9JY28_9EURO|nr:uncharacterized protein N7532_010584 [Penicillium argentinense]KAJ5085813.1 hypothetical protein N7532_010584 [Penicillium argentinense]